MGGNCVGRLWDWPRVKDEMKSTLGSISADRYSLRETAAEFGRRQAADSTGSRS
ncbi:hypothetical protein F2Q69_00019729 [Brassica cretica]|uniref:Uncharacterized protein n=1 Tax=Brassica cretica TaxID=69181 RepID=A0A8S9Q722_BRACR|nr:hypothetical protein F2Q69_00019729 [Brassica cretica]